MTATTDVRGSTTATAAPGRRHRPRGVAAYAVVVGLGLTLLVLLALTAQRPSNPLDPESPTPSGAMALVEVLRHQGVEVEVVRSIGALEASRPDTDTTVVVGDPTYLGRGATGRLAVATSTARATTTARTIIQAGSAPDPVRDSSSLTQSISRSSGPRSSR